MISSGGPRNTPPGTLTRLFFDAVARHDKPDALQVKVNGVYQSISSRTVAERVRRIALGLGELGVKSGERVGILSENRPEWAIADYACLTACLTDVPLYPNLPAEQAAYILRDSGAVTLFVSDAGQAAKIAEVRANCPALHSVITFASERHAGADMTFAEVEAKGAAVDSEARAAAYREHALAVQPDDVATIIYTSGTTGEPKGVMLTHDNLYSNVMASVLAIPFEGRDVGLSFLPLSHIFERMAGHYLMFHVGCSIAYAESIDTVPNDLVLVRPTLVLSVPRLYEKMYARVLDNALSGGAVKKRIFFWARGVAERWANVQLAGGEPAGVLAMQYRLAQKLVFSKLKARTGGRLRYFVSGGAPLAPEINKFFYAAGLEILEGYGLTETSPVIAVNTPEAFRIGTVGKPVAGVDVTIAPDGEILSRGPNVMKGYYNRPDATREAIDAEGWFHTGDIGELHDGFLSITDRKKDIIVTAGGKNVSPQNIENDLKASKYVSQALVVGDRRPYVAALITLDAAEIERWADERGIAGELATLVRAPQVGELVQGIVDDVNRSRSRFEQVKRFALLPRDFTMDEGELTPTLKLRRRACVEHFRGEVEELYR